MVVIIDGYNLLKRVFPYLRSKLEIQRDNLIDALGIYKNHKNFEIIIVFDGGILGHAQREIKQGVVVIFSGQKMSADEWIINYIERNKEKSFLLVTCDRSLIAQCQQWNVDPVDCSDFYRLVDDILVQNVESTLKKRNDFIKKYEHYEYEDNVSHEIVDDTLDILMEQASHTSSSKEDTDTKERSKSGYTPSKYERRINKKIKKL